MSAPNLLPKPSVLCSKPSVLSTNVLDTISTWGSDLIPADRRSAILDRLTSRSQIIDLGFVVGNRPSPCFIWQGGTSGTGRGGGYGRMSLDGVTVATHLVSFTHFFGYIPGKKQVDHLCNNRLCWNPAHLELVSHLTNQRRRAKRATKKSQGN